MQYLALFLTPELDVIGKKKINPLEKFITYKKGTFKIDLDSYFYKIKDTRIYGYIYPTDERLLVDMKIEPIKKTIDGKEENIKIESARIVKLKEKIDNGDLHFLVSQQIIGQLARAFLGIVKTNWVVIILALGCGIAIGYIACTLINPTTATTIINNSTIPTLTPTPIVLK